MVSKQEIIELYLARNRGQVPAVVMRQLDKYEEDAKGIQAIDLAGKLLASSTPARYLEAYEIIEEITEAVKREYMDLGRAMYRSEALYWDVQGRTGDLPGGNGDARDMLSPEDRRRLRERELQEEHGLSIRESEVWAGLAAGERPSDLARRLGIRPQEISLYRGQAAAKIGHT